MRLQGGKTIPGETSKSILAWLGREEIAESLSQVALTEIIGVVLVYGIKSLIENLSKNNSWPDKKKTNADDASSDGLG